MFTFVKMTATESRDFRIVKLLVERKVDKMGTEVDLLVVPAYFMLQVKMLCHEETSGHLGVAKKSPTGEIFLFSLLLQRNRRVCEN